MISVKSIFIKTKFNHIKFPIRELKQKNQICNICKSKQSDNIEYKYKICNTKIQKSANYFPFEEHWGRKCSYKIFYPYASYEEIAELVADYYKIISM